MGSMVFIGIDRLLVAEGAERDAFGVPDLVLFGAPIPADAPSTPSEVRFVCDPRYRGMCVRVMAEEAAYSNFSGVTGQDIPFYPDPSQRVLVLLFYPRADASNKTQGICVVRSETLLRLAREIGEGVVEWDVWGKFTVAPDADEVPGADLYTKYSVSGSRFVRVDSNEAERWVKVRVCDLSHWSRQHPHTQLGGDEGSDGEKARCRLTQATLKMPENMWSICHVAMLQDSMVFFGVGPPALAFGCIV